MKTKTEIVNVEEEGKKPNTTVTIEETTEDPPLEVVDQVHKERCSEEEER